MKGDKVKQIIKSSPLALMICKGCKKCQHYCTKKLNDE